VVNKAIKVAARRAGLTKPEGVKPPKSHPKPHSGKCRTQNVECRKAVPSTSKPYTRHILGTDSGVQGHHKPYTVEYRATQGHPKATQGYTKARHLWKLRYGEGGLNGWAVIGLTEQMNCNDTWDELLQS